MPREDFHGRGCPAQSSPRVTPCRRRQRKIGSRPFPRSRSRKARFLGKLQECNKQRGSQNLMGCLDWRELRPMGAELHRLDSMLERQPVLFPAPCIQLSPLMGREGTHDPCEALSFSGTRGHMSSTIIHTGQAGAVGLRLGIELRVCQRFGTR